MTKKYSLEDLTKRAKSPGWMHHADEEQVTGTLEDVAKAAHDRRKSGKPPGLIKEIETAIELEMIQLEQLWQHLGLPM